MNQIVTPEVLKQFPAEFWDVDSGDLNEVETALRRGYKELSGHVARLTSELEAELLGEKTTRSEKISLIAS